jgi:predicted HicB family RNase H-like nuclease
MKDVMEYKGYIGSVHFVADDEIFFGKIEAINDLIMFEGQSVQELKKAFYGAVDDYLATCQKMGREPNKTFKGSFNVRIGRELHVKAYKAALKRE